MFKERLHKLTGELKEEAKRIGTRLKEEFLESDTEKTKDDNKIIPN